ncbi:UNKNOWN [Stylonychia lemnae]|uniref:Uncharacterized protein n=1 Tax=Stylonychia lemnae TaxID=5949 RepID=A0A078B403_STYLE|nr:UNKNOWN [Stylonychia lemnae]|eukprot:CDW87917.1 UNKNOWN [Stylonychia lemnae]
MEFYFKQRQLLNETDLAISLDHNNNNDDNDKYSYESQEEEESEQYEDEHRNDFEDMTSDSENETSYKNEQSSPNQQQKYNQQYARTEVKSNNNNSLIQKPDSHNMTMVQTSQEGKIMQRSSIGDSTSATTQNEDSSSYQTAINISIRPPEKLLEPRRIEKKEQLRCDDEDIVKKNFKRFLRLVEQHKSTVNNQSNMQIQQQQQQAQKQNQLPPDDLNIKTSDDYNTKDLIQTEGIFQLFRIPGQHNNLVRRYCYMLDQDYNHNKVVSLINLIQQQQINPNSNTTRFFFNFDRENAAQMFGYRLAFNTQTDIPKQTQFIKPRNAKNIIAEEQINKLAGRYEIINAFKTKRRLLRPKQNPQLIKELQSKNQKQNQPVAIQNANVQQDLALMTFELKQGEQQSQSVQQQQQQQQQQCDEEIVYERVIQGLPWHYIQSTEPTIRDSSHNKVSNRKHLKHNQISPNKNSTLNSFRQRQQYPNPTLGQYKSQNASQRELYRVLQQKNQQAQPKSQTTQNASQIHSINRVRQDSSQNQNRSMVSKKKSVIVRNFEAHQNNLKQMDITGVLGGVSAHNESLSQSMKQQSNGKVTTTFRQNQMVIQTIKKHVQNQNPNYSGIGGLGLQQFVSKSNTIENNSQFYNSVVQQYMESKSQGYFPQIQNKNQNHNDSHVFLSVNSQSQVQAAQAQQCNLNKNNKTPNTLINNPNKDNLKQRSVTEDDSFGIGIGGRKKLENKIFQEDMMNIQNTSIERYMKRQQQIQSYKISRNIFDNKEDSLSQKSHNLSQNKRSSGTGNLLQNLNIQPQIQINLKQSILQDSQIKNQLPVSNSLPSNNDIENITIGRNNANTSNLAKLIQPNVSKTGLNLTSLPNPPMLFVQKYREHQLKLNQRMEKRNLNDLSFNKSDNGNSDGVFEKVNHRIMMGDSKQPFTKIFNELDNNLFYNSKHPPSNHQLANLMNIESESFCFDTSKNLSPLRPITILNPETQHPKMQTSPHSRLSSYHYQFLNNSLEQGYNYNFTSGGKGGLKEANSIEMANPYNSKKYQQIREAGQELSFYQSKN